MKPDKLKIDVIQDGQKVKNGIIKQYDLEKNDIFYSSSGVAYSNFVGMVQRGTRILVSIPKHFKSVTEFESTDTKTKIKNIKLIIDTIKTNTLDFQNTTYETNKNFSSEFALNAYFNIYTYFSEHGPYVEELEEISKKNGKIISWKNTLSRSNKFLIKGNLVYSPIFYKKKKKHETLVTECMIFALNYTQNILGDFMTLPNTSNIANRGVDLSILGNEFIIYELEEILCNTFKDINRQLIKNIIIFLKRVNSMKEQIPSFKEYNYEIIWEKAVEKYLNIYWSKIKIDCGNNNIKTSNKNIKLAASDVYKRQIINHEWKLEPDHFYKDKINKIIYILDSKYYTSINKLNHKQFVYHILLSNKFPNYQVFDSLILPSKGKTGIKDYLDVDKSYLGKGKKHIKIHIIKLNMIQVLKNYVN